MCGQKLKHTHQSKYTEVTKFNRKSSRKIQKKKKKKRLIGLNLPISSWVEKLRRPVGLALNFPLPMVKIDCQQFMWAFAGLNLKRKWLRGCTSPFLLLIENPSLIFLICLNTINFAFFSILIKKTTVLLFFLFFLDRRNGKAIITSHISGGIGVRPPVMTSGLTISTFCKDV